MEEDEFHKIRVLGFAPPDRVRGFVASLGSLGGDDLMRLSRVAKETFSVFSTASGVVEALYEIDPDYAVGYLCKVKVHRPGDAQRVVDDLSTFLCYGRGGSLSDIRRPIGIFVDTCTMLKSHFYNSSVVTSWIKANSAVINEDIRNDRGGLSKEEFNALVERKKMWELIVKSWSP